VSPFGVGVPALSRLKPETQRQEETRAEKVGRCTEDAATLQRLNSCQGRYLRVFFDVVATICVSLQGVWESDATTSPSASLSKRRHYPPLVPTAEDIRLLVSYPWPGNVRELAAVIERAAILGGGEGLQVAQALGTVPARSPQSPPPHARIGSAIVEEEGRVNANGLTLDAAMTRHIESVLRHTHGRIEGPGGAAKRLGINPHTLRARMRKLGIDWQRFRLRDGE
jgi:hypothetical protein